MTQCNLENLAQLLSDHLDLDGKLVVLEHLEECETCRVAFYQLSRERDASFFIHRPYNVEKVVAGTT